MPDEQIPLPRRDQSVQTPAENADEYFGPRWLARAHERLHRNPVTGALTTIVVTLAGVLVMAAGLVMMVTPGPGILGLVLGLAILSTEWRWADRWLDAARASARRAADKARAMDPRVRRRRVAAGLVVIAVAAAVVVLCVHAFGWPQVAEDGWGWLQARAEWIPELPGMDL